MVAFLCFQIDVACLCVLTWYCCMLIPIRFAILTPCVCQSRGSFVAVPVRTRHDQFMLSCAHAERKLLPSFNSASSSGLLFCMTARMTHRIMCRLMTAPASARMIVRTRLTSSSTSGWPSRMRGRPCPASTLCWWRGSSLWSASNHERSRFGQVLEASRAPSAGEGTSFGGSSPSLWRCGSSCDMLPGCHE